VGSITHAGSLAAAVVAHATDARGLGLDIELLEPPLDPKVQRLLFTPSEISHVQALGAIEPGAANILFSAKESVYKCVFPRTRRRLGPHEVAVALDLGRRRFRAVVSEGSHGGEPALEGTFQLVAGYVLTGLCM
jgi:4'-phosphopantetheinyl transferase EntD